MILVVDDDLQVATFLTDALSGEGYEVMWAEDGVQAYDLARRPECKLMLLDLQMPRINGVELLLAMKADGLSVPTIVMTGLSDVMESEALRLPSVRAFLRKPFSFASLESLVRDALGKTGPGPG